MLINNVSFLTGSNTDSATMFAFRNLIITSDGKGVKAQLTISYDGTMSTLLPVGVADVGADFMSPAYLQFRFTQSNNFQLYTQEYSILSAKFETTTL